MTLRRLGEEPGVHRRRGGVWTLLVGLIAATLLSGCTLFDLAKVRETERMDARYARVSGTLSPGPVAADWMVVFWFEVPCDADWAALREAVAHGRLAGPPGAWRDEDVALVSRLRGKATVAEHFVLERPGPWWVDLAPGCYGVGAFADLDRNYRYDDEPAVTAVSGPERLLELSPGEVVEEVDLVIDPDGRLAHGLDPRAEQLRAAELRSHGEQMLVSVSQVSVEGEVVSLPDARFGKESGRLGYFEIYRFLWEVGPGIYFLEEYDPDRIPVLFVHGALGYPQEFEALIGALDRSRFQPWVAFYPSGADLAAVSEYFSRTVSSLRLRLGFDALAVVAHSMGGLVARDLILRHHETSAHDPFVLLVSISTPWGGMPSARAGSEHSPFVVPSWRDVRPDSPFLSGLFYLGEDGGPRRRLPDRLGFHLLFGVADQTVPLPSAIRWEAVREARARWPLPYGHADVLRSPEAAELLVEILDGLR